MQHSQNQINIKTIIQQDVVVASSCRVLYENNRVTESRRITESRHVCVNSNGEHFFLISSTKKDNNVT